jgi:hypothetical protein
MMDLLWLDVRDAWRGIRRNRLFACGVAGTIGIGLGFLCSAFTVVNAYLLKPFEVRDPRALYQVAWRSTSAFQHAFTIDELSALRDESKDVFDDVIGFAMLQIAYDDAPLWGQIVTGNYFEGSASSRSSAVSFVKTTRPGRVTGPWLFSHTMPGLHDSAPIHRSLGAKSGSVRVSTP